MTPGRLLGPPQRFKLAIGMVGGIEIKGTRARYFFGGYGQGNQ